MLNSGDLGHRVVVRHRTDRGPTDVLGELTSIDDHGLVVRTEAGDERRIARAAVIAGKRVGPRPARFSEILALERIAAAAWPAPETERLGEWLLRAADGWTNRANSALPLGDAGCDLDEAVAACVAFYTARGLPPKITVPLPVRRDVARHLAEAGWIAQPEVLVQTAALDRVIALASQAAAGRAGAPGSVTLHDRPPPDVLSVVAARKDGLPPAAEHVLTGVDAVRFAVARDADGTLLANARGAVVQRWLHIGLVEVLPHARRRGFARAVTTALAEWAQEAGATRAVLQVEGLNEPARRLYESLGWRTHHTFVTYRRPPDPA
ncbi:MAG: GNAT family N-acetyltransferase [Micromonosporaceae bacterium]|nr:GNAT family N-acetyltransferase [Micromonosporaceae bacterium]